MKSNKYFLPLLLLLYCILQKSCESLDVPELIPSYIHIPEITLINNPDINEGTLSNNIVDAWVFVNDELIGAFELPATFPVLKEGQHKITIMAGIYMNGVRTTRVYYPFYNEYTIYTTLYKDSVITIDPVVSYNSNIKIPFHETFELGGVLLEEETSSLAVLEKTNDTNKVYEGNYSGKITLTRSDSIYQGVSIMPYTLPSAGGNVFLELNYKSETDIIIGLYAIKHTQILKLEVAGILPRQEWNKIYINFSPTVFRENDAINFKVFLGSILPQGMEEATILIDNLKLIHF